MPELTTKARDQLRKSDFAYVDADGEGHLPINDASHVRNAIARWNQTEFQSVSAKENARKKILRAAKRFDVEIGEDARVTRPAKSLRAASTKAGPRGGKKD